MKTLAFYLMLACITIAMREYQQAEIDREVKMLKQRHEQQNKQLQSNKRCLAMLSQRVDVKRAAGEVYIAMLRAK